MEAVIRDLLAELEAWGAANDEAQQDRSNKMLNLEQETAQLISILIRTSGSKHLLEIGTSNGYSTIWLAWAARQTGGRIISIDRSAEKHRLAEANLRRAGLATQVDLMNGDATTIVTDLPGPFDVVFFDADRLSAPTQLEILRSKLTPNALVLADNVLSHPEEIAPYLKAIEGMSEFDHMVVPIGKGLSLAYKAPNHG